MYVFVPDELGRELEKIDWQKVSKADLKLLIAVGIPLLKRKGYLITNKKEDHK